jgi:hypothetical protein
MSINEIHVVWALGKGMGIEFERDIREELYEISFARLDSIARKLIQGGWHTDFNSQTTYSSSQYPTVRHAW